MERLPAPTASGSHRNRRNRLCLTRALAAVQGPRRGAAWRPGRRVLSSGPGLRRMAERPLRRAMGPGHQNLLFRFRDRGQSLLFVEGSATVGHTIFGPWAVCCMQHNDAVPVLGPGALPATGLDTTTSRARGPAAGGGRDCPPALGGPERPESSSSRVPNTPSTISEPRCTKYCLNMSKYVLFRIRLNNERCKATTKCLNFA